MAPAQLRPARGLAPQERPPEMREQRTPSFLPALTHPQASLSPAERTLRARLAALRLDDAPAEQRADWLARVEAYLRLGIARGAQSARSSLMEPPP